MMDAVFFDSNRIRNTGVHFFFAHADEIKRIANVAQVYIPSIVMDEIKQQKLRKLEENLAKFKSNYFTEHLDIETDNLEEHISKKLEELYDNAPNEFDYIEYALKDDLEHIDTLKTLALKKHPPFSKDDGSDKGFKDALIYLVIKQYLEDNPEDEVFLFTKDGRLKEAFNNHDRVEILWEFREYFDYRKGYFKDDYFLEKLEQFLIDESLVQEIRKKTAEGTLELEMEGWEEKLAAPIRLNKSDVKNIDFTEDEDWKILIEPEGVQVEISVDFFSKEITSGEVL